NVFDFGDTGRGAADRNKQQAPKLNTAYEVIYKLAAKYQDAEAQGIANWLHRELKTTTWEKAWAFYAHDPGVRPLPMRSVPTSYYFRNAETAFWRSSWEHGATAFAFRCGPPEGHHVAELAPLMSDWRQSTGHAHPDANSFIIYSHGEYLTGDTGYTGVKLTEDHNTILVDGRGQENDGRHEVFKEVPNARLDKLRVAEYWSTPGYFYARGEAASAYFSDLGVSRFDRHFLYVAPAYFVVWDELATTEPRNFSWLLNADNNFVTKGPADFGITNRNATLFVQRLLPASVKHQIVPQMVTTQGRPGEVEKGKLEQRGFQLVETTNVKNREIQFLHFLRPADNEWKRHPRVYALPGNGRGLRIEWPNGDKETVLLREESDDVKIRGDRAVVRISKQGVLQRLVLQRGIRVEHKGVELLRSSQPISIAVSIIDGKEWRGALTAESVTTIVLRAPVEPKLLVNGASIKSAYDANKKTITFEVGAGTNVIEAN
ncbi:MAG TPA: heparinase II/III family protein, partial [Pyrinomonadaceae bacterium]